MDSYTHMSFLFLIIKSIGIDQTPRKLYGGKCVKRNYPASEVVIASRGQVSRNVRNNKQSVSSVRKESEHYNWLFIHKFV